MNYKPNPDFWVIDFWKTGDKFKYRYDDIYYIEEVYQMREKIISDGYDNIQVIEVFYHPTDCIGIEACKDIDTRDLIYE